MPLNAIRISQILKAATPGKYADEGGLMLRVQKSGSALWQQKYRIHGVEKLASFGPFPDVGLAEARIKRDDLKALLRAGVDPMAEKKKAKVEAIETRANTFDHFAAAVLKQKAPAQAPQTRAKWELHMGYATARFGARPVAHITAREVLDFLTEFQDRGADHTCHSVKQKMGEVFARAVVAGACPADPTIAIGKANALRPALDTSHAAITDPTTFGELLRAIWGYEGDATTRGALKAIAYLFQRPHMIRHMRWAHINWDADRWEVPADCMKGIAAHRRDHFIPLCTQARQVIRDLMPLTGTSEFVFPARGTNGRPLSENTLNSALRRLGYDNDAHVSHGFRASANTMLLERLGFDQKVIDLQLAHIEPNKVRRAYDRTAFIDDRARMMQTWADYIDGLRQGGKLISFNNIATERG